MTVRIIIADVLEGLRQLPDESVHCVVTSPPYWGLRDYGVAGQIGLEPTPAAYLEKIVAVFGEVRRVLRSDGTLWLNIGDSYANDGKWGGETGGLQGYLDEASRKRNGREKRVTGLKPKELIGMPWRTAFALQDDGWWLRSEIIWAKPNPMPESVTDRPTKAHEHIFLLAKSERYFYDAEAIKETRTTDEDAVAFRGGSYVHGEPGPRAVIGNRKVPSGWNLGPGAHGSFRTDARVKLRRTDSITKSMVPGAAPHSQLHRAGQPREFFTRNKRTVWTIATAPFPEAHFATFPPELPGTCIKAGCPVGGTVLDPFAGAGTTLLMADRLQRHAIGIELNPEYAAIADRRLARDRGGLLALMEAAE